MTEEEVSLRHSISIFFFKMVDNDDYCNKYCPVHCNNKKDKKQCFERVVEWYKNLRERKEN